MSQIVTGEAVALDLRVARLGSRTIAALVDVLVELLLLYGALQLRLALGIRFDQSFESALLIVLSAFLMVGYPVLFETFWNGRTPGKAAMGLRVVRDDGGPIRFRHALGRGLLNLLERPGATLGFAAIVASMSSRRGKRVGDLVAGTVVLQERVPKPRMTSYPMPPQLAAWARDLDLTRLPDDLALAARDFLGRARQLRPDARERLGTQLCERMLAVVTPPPPPGTPGWAYLAAVLSERRRRDEQRLAGATAGLAAGATPGVRGVSLPRAGGAHASSRHDRNPESLGWQAPSQDAGAGGGAGEAPAAAASPGVGPSPWAGPTSQGVGPSPWPVSAPPTGAPPRDPGPPPVGRAPRDPGAPPVGRPSRPGPPPEPTPPTPPPGSFTPPS